MDFLEKRLYEIDKINNSNYKDNNNKNLKTPKLIKQYNLCNKGYINYLKSYFFITENKPKYINNKLTILDIASGTGLLALSFLNAIYEKDKEYVLILNDILFNKSSDKNIGYIKSIIEDIDENCENITIEINAFDLKTNDLEEFNKLKNFVLISDPTISTNNANCFETVNDFFENDNINSIFSKATYIIFKDSIKLKTKYKRMFENEKYDTLIEGLNFDLITNNDINILKLFDKNINNEINSLVCYSSSELANIYFFNSKSKLQMGEENSYFYQGYAIDYSSIAYLTIEEENKKMKDTLNIISENEIMKKYEYLKGNL